MTPSPNPSANPVGERERRGSRSACRTSLSRPGCDVHCSPAVIYVSSSQRRSECFETLRNAGGGNGSSRRPTCRPLSWCGPMKTGIARTAARSMTWAIVTAPAVISLRRSGDSDKDAPIPSFVRRAPGDAQPPPSGPSSPGGLFGLTGNREQALCTGKARRLLGINAQPLYRVASLPGRLEQETVASISVSNYGRRQLPNWSDLPGRSGSVFRRSATRFPFPVPRSPLYSALREGPVK